MTYFDDFAVNFVRSEILAQEEKKKERNAHQFVKAIKTIANKPQNLENLENYLSHHFPEWLEKFANSPETITAELTAFAEMDI